MNQILAKFMQYSMTDIGWDYDKLTPQEQSFLTRAQYAELKTWCDEQSPPPVLRVITTPPPDLVADVAEFHEKFGLEYRGKPRFLLATSGKHTLGEFRRKFLHEESDEYKVATYQGEYFAVMPPEGRVNGALETQMENALDALVDLVYVALGNSYMHGFDFYAAWKRVHDANMAKVRGNSERGGTFDIVKPPGWKAPSHADLVSDHAHKEKFNG